MPTFKIIWKSYKSDFPSIISQENFNSYKSETNLEPFKVKFGFFEEFFVQLIIIVIAILFLLSDIYHMLHGGLAEFIEVIFLLGGGYTLIYFILSAISFISNYIDNKHYLSHLYQAITLNDSYKDFCITMSKIDPRYIMHIRRNRL